MTTSPLPAAIRERLNRLHAALLRLHKILLDDERAAHEQVHGRVPPGRMLQLVINEPQFAWLRRISELIVQIDETVESEEPDSETRAGELLKQIRALLAADSDSEFARKYRDALQRLPDAVLAHNATTSILK